MNDTAPQKVVSFPTILVRLQRRGQRPTVEVVDDGR